MQSLNLYQGETFLGLLPTGDPKLIIPGADVRRALPGLDFGELEARVDCANSSELGLETSFSFPFGDIGGSEAVYFEDSW